MTDEEVKLVAYWNGDESNPEITFDVRENDTRQLVVITITPVPAGQSKSNYDITKGTAELKKISRELRNLTIATRRLK